LKSTLLLVEDNKVQKLVNERILHRAGYTVLNAADGEEAVRIARQTIPDIILLDMLLPKLGGREVMQALRETPATAQIPVLVFSSLPQANEGKLKKEGAAGYFVKSRLVEKGSGELDLVEMIERLLEESRRRKQAAMPATSRAHTAG
jgi:two-component system, OmpR family, phosphate regulon response regulator PhoB